MLQREMGFKVLIKEFEGGFMAHCLELDIVTTAKSREEVENDIVDLIVSQIAFAFAHDNLDYLYHPAPKDIWKEYFECPTPPKLIKREVVSEEPLEIVPPWIIASLCELPSPHA